MPGNGVVVQLQLQVPTADIRTRKMWFLVYVVTSYKFTPNCASRILTVIKRSVIVNAAGLASVP